MMHSYVTERDGLGMATWVQALIAIGSSVAGAVATKAIAGPSSPSQKDVEAAIKAQTQADIQRMYSAAQIQSQQTSELGQYVVPALGALALVMLLR